MNDLQTEFGDKLAILAFPCNQFGHQENTKNEEILNCLKYVRPGDGFVPLFPVFEKTVVNGTDQDPIFEFLKESLPTPFDVEESNSQILMKDPKSIIWAPVRRYDIAWNFEKFLLDQEGIPQKRYSRYFHTKDIAADIQKLLQ
mmetsp:Transcript_38214/g.75214  ORF Transcript_38214/g.75214 Transcript_38214/m.75214 type:complete len:143 (+) Transcript_38214:193-621(+)